MVQYIDLTFPVERGSWFGLEIQDLSSRRLRDFPCLTSEAARHLAERRIALLGVDTPSPSPPDDPGQGIHKTLLGAGIVLLERLANLDRLRASVCELIVLPPLFKGLSGSPCRAVAVQTVQPPNAGSCPQPKTC